MVKKIRYWLVSLLLTKDEKYLLIRSIDERLYKVESLRVSMPFNWINADDYWNDMLEYKLFRDIFSTELWR